MKKKDTTFNIIIYVIIALIIIIAIYMYKGYKEDQKTMNTYNLVLKGNTTINIYEGGKYIEPGFNCYNYENIDHPELVKTEGTVNTSVVGTYKIRYYIENAYYEFFTDLTCFFLFGRGPIGSRRSHERREL